MTSFRVKPEDDGRLIFYGGISGIVSISCYVLAITAPLPALMAYVLAELWPILSIVYSYALYRLIAIECQGHFNRLSFVFAVMAFLTVSIMVSVQLAVGVGYSEVTTNLSPDQIVVMEAARHLVRLIDMGIDVIWDVFIGVAMILSAVAMVPHPRLGTPWGLPSGLLGAALIVLNVATFPWPPADRGLFDIGPIVGLYVVALSVHMIVISRTMRVIAQGAPAMHS